MNLKVLNKREQIILYATGGVIVFAVLFNFAIAPVLARNDTLNKEIIHNRAKLKKYAWLLSQKDSIRAKSASFNLKPEGAPGQKDKLVAALAELEEIAKSSNIKIIDIRPRATKGEAGYGSISIDLRADGQMDGYLKFFYNLENSLSLLRVQKFMLNSRANSASLEGNFAITQLSAGD